MMAFLAWFLSPIGRIVGYALAAALVAGGAYAWAHHNGYAEAQTTYEAKIAKINSDDQALIIEAQQKAAVAIAANAHTLKQAQDDLAVAQAADHSQETSVQQAIDAAAPSKTPVPDVIMDAIMGVTP